MPEKWTFWVRKRELCQAVKGNWRSKCPLNATYLVTYSGQRAGVACAPHKRFYKEKDGWTLKRLPA